MSTFRNLAFAAALATTAVAYSTPLEIRNDLDFAPEDLEVLFGRDLDFSPDDLDILFGRDVDSEAELANGEFYAREAEPELDETEELFSREADAYAEAEAEVEDLAEELYLRALLAREPSLFSSAAKLVSKVKPSKIMDGAKKVTSGLSKHKSTIKNVGEKVHNHKDTIKSVGHGASSVASTGMDLQSQYYNNQAQKQSLQQGQGGYSTGQGGASGVYRRDLFEEEDPEMWY